VLILSVIFSQLKLIRPLELNLMFFAQNTSRALFRPQMQFSPIVICLNAPDKLKTFIVKNIVRCLKVSTCGVPFYIPICSKKSFSKLV